MFDDCLESARQMITARLHEHVESFNSDVRELDLDMARKLNGGFGGWYIKAYKDICVKSLKLSAEFIFNTYRENLNGVGISIPSNDGRLIDDFTGQFTAFYNFVSEKLLAKKSDVKTGRHFRPVSLEHTRTAIMLDYTAR